MDLAFVLGREHDGREARIAGLEGDAGVAPAVAVLVPGGLLALVPLDVVPLAGLGVDLVPKLHEQGCPGAAPATGAEKRHQAPVGHRRFHRPADDLGDEHPTSQRGLRANPAPSKSSAGKRGGSPSAPAAALSGPAAR